MIESVQNDPPKKKRKQKKTPANTRQLSYMFAGLADEDVVTIGLQVMGEAGAKHILVTHTEGLHEHLLQVVTLVLQQLHQAPIQRLKREARQ